MINLLYAVLIVIAVKFAINFARYIQCKRYLSKYNRYITKPDYEFAEHQPQIIKLFKAAGVQDSVVTIVQEIGYGNLASSRPSVFSNLTNTREDIIGIVMQMFHQAIGIYRSRTLETFNPLYWVEFVIYLPKQTLKYVGVSPESAVIKIAQVAYWLLGIAATFLLGLFRAEIEQLVKGWITRLTP